MIAPRRRYRTGRSTVRILAWTIVVLAAGLVPSGLLAAAQDSSGDQQVSKGPCPAPARSWDILFLMDESQSLRENDPERDRIDAAKRYISNLGDIAGAGVRVRVALAAFGSAFDLRMDFTDLQRAGAIEEMHAVVDGFGADDLNTDYVLALYGALDLDWSAACNRVVWLTDGQHDLGDAYKGDRTPRPYDGLQRRITGRNVGLAVEKLLIPAVCGVEDGTMDEVAAGYGDLRSRMKELGVEIEDHLYYVGELVPGDTKTLIDRMQMQDCGRPVVPIPIMDIPEELPLPTTTTTTTTTLPTTTSTLPPPDACLGLPEPRLPAGKETVWSGDLPDGVAPAFVHSVIVRVTGDSPELETDHPFRRLDDDGPARRLTLDFSDEAWSSYSPDRLEVRGKGIDEACVAAVLEPPSLDARITTSPIFPDTPIELLITVDGEPLLAADERFLTVSLGGEPLGPETIGEGYVRIPEQDVAGEHTFEVRLVSDYADPAITSGVFTVSPKPDGPILQLDGSRLDPVAATEFTVPITVYDDGRPGEIRILPSDPIVGADGDPVNVEIRFPDGRSAWRSGDPRPDHLLVVLSDSVQTPEGHVLRLVYESDPSDPAGVTHRVPVDLRVDIDHPRKLVIEAIIISSLLVLLLLFIWAWLYGINRVAGRIRRPRRMRYAKFRLSDAWEPASDLADSDLRSPVYSKSKLEADALRATRKTSWLKVWKPSYIELSMSGGRRLRGLIGSGYDAMEVSGQSVKLSNAELEQPVVLVDVSAGPPFTGVVMARIDQSTPAEHQLTKHVQNALARVQPPGEC